MEHARCHQARQHFLAATGPFACRERRLDAESGHHSGAGIVHRDRVEDGFVNSALRRHHAAACLHERIEARVGGQFALRAVASDGTADDTRVNCREGRVVDAQSLAHAHAKVVEHDVCLPHHFEEDLAPGVLLEVDGKSAFAVVIPEEAEPVKAERIPIEGLDLDDVRAQVREESRGICAGNERPEVEDAHAGQRAAANRFGRGRHVRLAWRVWRGFPPGDFLEGDFQCVVPHRAGRVRKFCGHARHLHVTELRVGQHDAHLVGGDGFVAEPFFAVSGGAAGHACLFEDAQPFCPWLFCELQVQAVDYGSVR